MRLCLALILFNHKFNRELVIYQNGPPHGLYNPDVNECRIAGSCCAFVLFPFNFRVFRFQSKMFAATGWISWRGSPQLLKPG